MGGGRPGGTQARAVFRVISYSKTVRGAEQMIRYVAFRSKDLEDREKGCFDRDRDHADVRTFIEHLPDRLTRHSAAPKAFHCVFSLSREGFEQTGRSDMKQLVRDAMAQFEQDSRRKLEWIASYHDNPTHPHCHVIIKAVYETPDGHHRKLWMGKEALTQFRQAMIREVRDAQVPCRSVDRAAGPVIDARQVVRAFDSTMQWLKSMIRQEQRRRRQADREREEWLREQEERER